MERKRVEIKIAEARNLLAKDKNGFSDPYVELKMGGQKTKSKIIKKNLNPQFNETFQFEVKSTMTDVLEIDVFDYDRMPGRDDFLGRLRLPIADIQDAETGAGTGKWHVLQKRSEKSSVRGELHVEISFLDADGLPVSPAAGGGDGDGVQDVAGSPASRQGSLVASPSGISRLVSKIGRSDSTVSTGSVTAAEALNVEEHDGPWMLKVKVLQGKDYPKYPSITKCAYHASISLVGAAKTGANRVTTKNLPHNCPQWDETIRLCGVKRASLAEGVVKVEVFAKERHRTQVLGKCKFPLSKVPKAADTEEMTVSTGAQELFLEVPKRAKLLSPAATLVPGKGRGSVVIELALVPDESSGDDESGDDGDEPGVVDSVEGAAPITWPAPLQWVLVEEEMPCNVAKLHRLMFGKGSKFAKAFQAAQNFSEVTETEWSEEAKPKREVSYMMPASSLVKANRATETQLFEVKEVGGAVVNVTTATPDAPYGSTFLSKLQICLNHVGDKKSQLRISADMEFVKSTMMKSAILSGAKKGMTGTYTSYLEVLQRFASGKKRAAAAAGAKPAAGGGGGGGGGGNMLYLVVIGVLVLLVTALFFQRRSLAIQVGELQGQLQQAAAKTARKIAERAQEKVASVRGEL